MAEAGDVGPRSDDPEGIALLRSALTAANFTYQAVRDTLSVEGVPGRDSAEMPLYLYLLEGGGALATLIKLFLLALEVPSVEAAEAFDGLSLDRLQAMGVITQLDGRVAAAIELVPTDDLLVACDTFQDEFSRPDHVLGVSPSARVLAWLTVRAPVERALDLGTGNGQQALLAARHARHVTAIDINPRALSFTGFNAALNGAPPIELREGDLFEPVAGERFDLIVCNPPYVISPESGVAYRDGGLQGDSFCESIVRQLPAYLEDGGVAQVLVSWLHPRGGDWIAPVEGWLEGSGCDGLLIRYAEHDPLEYAAAWNRPLRKSPELYGAAIRRWIAYFEELGIEAISWGALTMRRRAGDNWFFPYTSTTDEISGASEQVLRLFTAQDYLASVSDEELLESVFELVSEHRVEQTLKLGGGQELVERNFLRLDRGLRFEVSIDQPAERVLSLLDGSRPVRPLLAEAATAVPGLPEERFVQMALPVVKRMIELGFVVPSGSAKPLGP
jgi:methylase of polypeptide subunit release factors